MMRVGVRMIGCAMTKRKRIIEAYRKRRWIGSGKAPTVLTIEADKFRYSLAFTKVRGDVSERYLPPGWLQ